MKLRDMTPSLCGELDAQQENFESDYPEMLQTYDRLLDTPVEDMSLEGIEWLKERTREEMDMCRMVLAGDPDADYRQELLEELEEELDDLSKEFDYRLRSAPE